MAEMINLLAVTTMANTRITVDVQKDVSVFVEGVDLKWALIIIEIIIWRYIWEWYNAMH